MPVVNHISELDAMRAQDIGCATATTKEILNRTLGPAQGTANAPLALLNDEERTLWDERFKVNSFHSEPRPAARLADEYIVERRKRMNPVPLVIRGVFQPALVDVATGKRLRENGFIPVFNVDNAIRVLDSTAKE